MVDIVGEQINRVGSVVLDPELRPQPRLLQMKLEYGCDCKINYLALECIQLHVEYTYQYRMYLLVLVLGKLHLASRSTP